MQLILNSQQQRLDSLVYQLEEKTIVEPLALRKHTLTGWAELLGVSNQNQLLAVFNQRNQAVELADAVGIVYQNTREHHILELIRFSRVRGAADNLGVLQKALHHHKLHRGGNSHLRGLMRDWGVSLRLVERGVREGVQTILKSRPELHWLNSSLKQFTVYNVDCVQRVRAN